MRILTAREVREAEAQANAEGLSYYLMMENAGRGCAGRIAALADKKAPVVILCGKGKNGGDGFVIARYLFSYGYQVCVIRMFDEPSDELSEQMAEILQDGVTRLNYIAQRYDSLKAVESAGVLVDAVFGIGFRGTMPEYIAELFANYPKYPALKVAVDVPSGLSAQEPSCADCHRADVTLSMLCFKPEHVYMPWKAFCGKTEIVPIGFKPEERRGLCSFTEKEAAALLPARPFNSHKGTYGHALIVAGSRNMPGAAVIAAKGALTAGAGLVTLAFPDCCYAAVTSQLSECVMLPLETAGDGSVAAGNAEPLAEALEKYTAAAVGCGLTTSEDAFAVLETLVSRFTGTLIVDADGINLAASHTDIWEKAAGRLLITPHPAEMGRLTGLSAQEVNAAREKTALGFAGEHNVTVLLKGVNTVVASPDGRVYVNPTGSSALSRGGSGDLLTGIVAALAAQGMPPFEAACMGAYVHGLAGMAAEEAFTSYAATVGRILSRVPDAFSQIIAGSGKTGT